MTSGQKNKMYFGAMDCCRKTFRNEGIRGFYRGLFISILSNNGGWIILLFYDQI